MKSVAELLALPLLLLVGIAWIVAVGIWNALILAAVAIAWVCMLGGRK